MEANSIRIGPIQAIETDLSEYGHTCTLLLVDATQTTSWTAGLTAYPAYSTCSALTLITTFMGCTTNSAAELDLGRRNSLLGQFEAAQLLVMSIIWCLSVPLYSMSGTDIGTYSPGIFKTCRNLCGKRTCALSSCVSETALSVLLDASNASTADSDPTSTQA